MYGLAVGPYGVILALSWKRDKEGQPTTVVALNDIGEPHLACWLDAFIHALPCHTLQRHARQQNYEHNASPSHAELPPGA